MKTWILLFLSTALMMGCTHHGKKAHNCGPDGCKHEGKQEGHHAGGHHQGGHHPGAHNPQLGVQSPSEAQVGARFDIMGSPHLTLDQKNKFMKVMNETQTKVAALRQKQGELKSALFKSLASGQYDQKSMGKFKKDLRKLEDDKMNLMFSSLDEVRTILGDKLKDTPDLLEHFHNRIL